MSKSYRQEHELMRRKVWADAYAFTANANDCKSTGIAIRYADAALEAFDIRFKPMEDDQVAGL